MLIDKICFDINYPNNWIICKDNLFDNLQIKITNNNICNINSKILLLIYIILKYVVENIKLDIKVKLYYNKFITKFESDQYNDSIKDLDYFIFSCQKQLNINYNNLIDTLNKKIKSN